LAGSTLVKVPQLLNVVRSRSAEGLNPLSFELETLGLLIATTYGFIMQLPVSAFGEVVVSTSGCGPAAPDLWTARRHAAPVRHCARPIAPNAPRRIPNRPPHTPTPTPPHTPHTAPQALFAQNAVLLFLVYHYQRRSAARAVALFALLAGWAALALGGGLSTTAITALYDCNNLILVAARLPQILQNFRTRSTGQLSGITYGLNTAGAAARIFTSAQEAAGAAMLRGAIVSECRASGGSGSNPGRRCSAASGGLAGPPTHAHACRRSPPALPV
jgi:uncharacterized protein with PQ loop repeat